MTDLPHFQHVNHGRNHRTATIVILIYFALIAAIIVVDAAWWLMAILAAFTLPALWDLATNRSAGVELNDTALLWYTGKRKATMGLSEIDHMRFDTRLDFSVRVSAVTPERKKIRLPYECLPPHRIFEDALTARGVRVERHHFTLMS